MKKEPNKFRKASQSAGSTTSDFDSPVYIPGSDLATNTIELITSPIIYFSGPEFMVTLMNESARNLWSVSLSEVLQVPLSEQDVAIRNFFEPYLREVSIHGMTVIDREVVPGLQDGKKASQFFDMELKPVTEKEGSKGILCLLTDVTDEANTHLYLRKKSKQIQQQLQFITDAMPLMIAYIDKNGMFRFANKMFETAFGISSQESFLKQLHEVFDEKIVSVFEPYCKQALSGVLTEFKCNFTLQNQRKVFESHFLPHFNSDNSVNGFYAIMFDITERKHITHAASDNDGKISTMRTTLDNMLESIQYISKKLDAARVKLNRARRENPATNEAMKKWTSDLQVSEAITKKVKTALDVWLKI
jgi:PAS domain S-box-containing protein